MQRLQSRISEGCGPRSPPHLPNVATALLADNSLLLLASAYVKIGQNGEYISTNWREHLMVRRPDLTWLLPEKKAHRSHDLLSVLPGASVAFALIAFGLAAGYGLWAAILLVIGVAPIGMLIWLFGLTWHRQLVDRRRGKRLMQHQWAALYHEQQLLSQREAALAQRERELTDYQLSLEQGHQRAVLREKGAALGALVAGVAHELNNPLMAVIGYAELLRAEQPLSPQQLADLEQICRAAWSAQEVVSQLSHYDRWGAPILEALHPMTLLTQLCQQNEGYELEHGIELVLEIDPAVGMLLGDEAQLSELLQRLLDNAAQALADWPGERRISLRAHPYADLVRLEVADSGPGIASSLRATIFDPFVTTHPDQLGLGLWVASRIVAAHNGYIQALASPEGGATLAIDLPQAQ